MQGRQEAPHPHALIGAPASAGRPQFAYATDLGCDTICCYRLDRVSGCLSAADLPVVKTAAGVGPRHLTFHPDGRRLYVINELANTMGVYDFDNASGRLTLVEIVNSRGRGPQNILITPDGGLLLCANMPGNSLTVFRIDRTTGRLTPVGDPIAIELPSSIAIVHPSGERGRAD